jgi:hypothetical protein
VCGDDFADGAAGYAPVGFDTVFLGTADGAADHGKALLFGAFAGGLYLPGACRVDGTGFFDETVFVLPDGIVEVYGTEHGRGAQQDDVDSGINDFPEGVEAQEAVFVCDVLSFFFQCFAAGVQPVFKNVAEGGYLYAFSGIQEVTCGACSAAAAPDQPGLERRSVRRGREDVGDGYFFQFFLSGSGAGATAQERWCGKASNYACRGVFKETPPGQYGL